MSEYRLIDTTHQGVDVNQPVQLTNPEQRLIRMYLKFVGRDYGSYRKTYSSCVPGHHYPNPRLVPIDFHSHHSGTISGLSGSAAHSSKEFI